MAEKPFIFATSHFSPTFQPPFLIWPTSDGPLRFPGALTRERSPSPSPRRPEPEASLFCDASVPLLVPGQAEPEPNQVEEALYEQYYLQDNGAEGFEAAQADASTAFAHNRARTPEGTQEEAPSEPVQGILMESDANGMTQQTATQESAAEQAANGEGAQQHTSLPSYTVHYIGIAQGELGILSRKQVGWCPGAGV